MGCIYVCDEEDEEGVKTIRIVEAIKQKEAVETPRYSTVFTICLY